MNSSGSSAPLPPAVMETSLESSLQQEATFRQVFDQTHSYFKPMRRNDRGVALEPARLLLLQRVPRQETDTSRYNFPYEFIAVDDPAPAPLDGGPTGEEAEQRLDAWAVEDREEEESQRLLAPHAALQKPIKQMLRYLEADHLAKLAVHGTPRRAVRRQLQVDRLAKQMRIVFAALPMCQSRALNYLLLESLPRELLASYLEGLRAVHIRWPTYVEEQLAVDPGPALRRISVHQVKQFIATEPPVVPVEPVPKIEKAQPVLIVVPHCEGENSRRFKAFTDMLRAFCEVKIMPPIRLPKQPSPETDPARSVQEFLCSEIKHIHLLRPKTPIFVLGWGSGASLAAPSISPSLGSARGFVALALPLQGGHGRRGYCEDKLINALATPTLFVTGALSQRGSPAQAELVRSRLGVESRLVVIGGADHLLRLTARWKARYAVTQLQVDRQVVMEVRRFVQDLINSSNAKSGGGNSSSGASSPPSSSGAGRQQPGGPPVSSRGRGGFSHLSGGPSRSGGLFPHQQSSHPPHHFPGQGASHHPPGPGRPALLGDGGARQAMHGSQMSSGRYRRAANRRPMGSYRSGGRDRRAWGRDSGLGQHRQQPYDSYRQSSGPPMSARGGHQFAGRPPALPVAAREMDASYEQETAAAIQSIT